LEPDVSETDSPALLMKKHVIQINFQLY